MADLDIDLLNHNYKKERASSFSTIVAKSERLEYFYVREQIHDIKTYLKSKIP